MKKNILFIASILASAIALANAPFMNLWDGVKMPGGKTDAPEYMKGNNPRQEIPKLRL